MMKKVLFIGVTNYNLKDGEASQHFKNKFEGISKGMDVFVLAKGHPFYIRKWNTDFYLFPANIFYWPLAFFLAFYLCLTKKIDVIVCQSPLVEGFVGSILKKIFRKELIVEIHGDWIEGPFLSKKRRFEPIERKVVPYLAKISLRSADKIRAVANYLIDQAKEIAPRKQYFIFPTFTDLSIFLDEKDIKLDKFILFVGHLEKVKGVNILIDAFAKISKDFPDFKLVLVGRGAEKENYQMLVDSHQLQDRIEFKGKLSLEQTKDIMKNCHCFVLPSLSEGLPRVIMEAMALGKPVVASDVGGIPELVKNNENGFLFERGSSNELAEKLSIILRNKDLAIKMGEKGREVANQNFSNEKYLQNYIKMINQ